MINPKLLPYLYQEDLYRLSDPEIVNPETEETAPDPAEVQFEVLVVLDDPQIHLELLEKILQSVSLKTDQVRIVSADKALDSTQYKKALVFTGKEWSNLSWLPYQIQSKENLSYLIADSLESISQDVNLKKKLWAGLKQLFSEQL